MTTDELIAMHKICVKILEVDSLIPEDVDSEVKDQFVLEFVRSAVRDLATVQRDILANMLQSILRSRE